MSEFGAKADEGRRRSPPSKREEMDASRFVAKFPVIRLEFPVGRKNLPDSLLREFPKKSLRRSGFLL
jgi:hypothetical protein